MSPLSPLFPRSELRLIIRDRVEGSAQGLLNQKVLSDQMKTLSDMIGTLARSCVGDAHLSILPNMLSRVRQVSGRNTGRNGGCYIKCEHDISTTLLHCSLHIGILL